MWCQSNNIMHAIGHRGCRGPHQENSLSAIQWAYDNGAWAVEVDVWLVEGRAVLFHDRLADKYIGSSEFTKNVPLSTLRNVMDVPELQDALALIPSGRGFNIEIKDADVLLTCINIVETAVDLGVVTWDQILFSSFDHRILADVKRLLPVANIAPLFSSIPVGLCSYAKQLGAAAINMDINCLDEDTVAQAHNHDLAVFVYTVNGARDINVMAEWGVDGVFVMMFVSLGISGNKPK